MLTVIAALISSAACSQSMIFFDNERPDSYAQIIWDTVGYLGKPHFEATITAVLGDD